MAFVALEILVNWVGMGLIIAGVLICCLYFAILCEKVVDFVRDR